MSPSTVHRLWSELRPEAAPRRDLQVEHRPGRSRPRSATWSGSTSTRPTGPSSSSVDEKTQIQALDRTQPMLPMRPGQVERHTHDYTRHGTTCLFAALEVGSGAVTTDHRARHTGADFLAFMKRVARAYPEGELHVVLDNVSARTRPPTSGPGSSGHPRITFHFTPDLGLVDEPGRDLVRHPHAPRHPAGGSFAQRQGAHRHDRCLHPPAGTTGRQSLRLGQDRRCASSPRPCASRQPISESGH